jgi:hypothetical protein
MFIEITTTIGCVNNCAICPQALFVQRYYNLGGKQAPRFLSYRDFLTILSKIPKKTKLIFSGFSEPFQNPECTDMILAAYKKGFSVHIYTTLYGLSLQNLNRILKNMPKGKLKPQLYIHIPSVENIEYIPTTPEYFKTLNGLLASGFHPLNFHYHGSSPRKDIQKLIEDAGYTVDFWQPQARAGNVKHKIISEVPKKYGMIYCDQIRRRGHIVLPDGTTVLCCMDFGMKHVLGNLLKSSYKSLHTGKEWKNILHGLNDDRTNILCRYCNTAYDNSPKIKPISKLISESYRKITNKS